MRHIKIGLDFHGVIDKDFDFYRKFCKLAIAKGHIIYIITGGPQTDVENILQDHNIPFTRVFAIVDYFRNLGLTDNNNRVEKELWDKRKAEYCEEEQIDIHIDDSLDYCRYFKSFCLLYDNQTKTCMASEKTIVFNHPAGALKIVEYLAKQKGL